MLEPIYFREQLPIEHARDLQREAARNHLLASLNQARRRTAWLAYLATFAGRVRSARLLIQAHVPSPAADRR